MVLLISMGSAERQPALADLNLVIFVTAITHLFNIASSTDDRLRPGPPPQVGPIAFHGRPARAQS